MNEVAAGLQRIFRAHEDDFLGRLNTLEGAVAAISAGTLNDELRVAAERDAHKLVGSLGTFGLRRGSKLGLALEQGLGADRTPAAADGAAMYDCLVALRKEVEDEYARLKQDAPAGPGLALVTTTEPDPSEVAADERRELRMALLENGLGRAESQEIASRRILVVDDDDAVREVLVTMLRDAGYDARGVGSAREARHALECESIALLLSDVSMPGESGLDLIRFALCEHPETATLLISALEDPGIAQVAMDFGAYGYLSKPVRRSAVLVGVMSALRRREVEEREHIARSRLEDILDLRTSALTEALLRLEGAATQSRVLQAETIHRWAQSAEYRDPGIGRHLKRVGHYCAALGQTFGLHAESIELASVLHDVGKLAVPDSILLKPGPLNAEERLAIETHAAVGHDLLRGSRSGVLELAAVIAHTHHEKFDGTGYPRGLSGTAIPLEGRIAAVADVFDALTSDRVYRQAWSMETTVTWMTRERGKHFDPEVLDAFLSSIDEIQSVQSLMSS